jgi:hypothetical protein
MKVPGGMSFKQKCWVRGYPEEMWLIYEDIEASCVAPVSDQEVESFLVEVAKVRDTREWPKRGGTSGDFSKDLYDLPF